MPTVPNVRTREDLIERATVLRWEGRKYREIAAELRISVPYANELVRDPNGWRERRRREAPQACQDGEVALGKMARLIAEDLGFTVDRGRVLWAARHEKIPSRRGPKQSRYFTPADVLAAIHAGSWRPHRPTRREDGKLSRVWVTCANEDCTEGEDDAGRPNGCRWEGWKPRSQVDRAKHVRVYTDAEGRPCADGMPCSQKCAPAVLKGRRRTVWTSRQCAGQLDDGSSCTRFIRVTARQLETGRGPKLCKACIDAGRRTVAQIENARRMGSQNRDSDAARKHRAEHALALGAQNARDPEHLDKLIEARMRAHAAQRAERRRRIIDALRTDAQRSDKVIARQLHTSPAKVALVRFELGIPLLSGKPQKQPQPTARRRRDGRVTLEPVEGVCDYTPAVREYVRKGPKRREQAKSDAVADARAQADRAEELHALGWEVAAIAAEIGSAVPSTERYLRDRGRSERTPGRSEAKQRRRILEHLERAGGSDERRSVQRATKIPAVELAIRLDELEAESYTVDGRACLRVSPKTITPSPVG